MAKLELKTHNFKQFEAPGTFVEGEIKGFFEIGTRFGQQQCIELKDPEGEEFCIGCTSNLALYLPQLAPGMKVRIIYIEDRKNDKTKNTYRFFEIDVQD